MIDVATIVTVVTAATAVGGPVLYLGRNIGKLEATIDNIIKEQTREREERIAGDNRLHERIDERDC